MSDSQTDFENNGHGKSQDYTILQLENDNESSLSKTDFDDNKQKKSTVDSLLKLEEDDENSRSELEDDDGEYSVEEEDPALVQTKHSIVNSPHTRFGVVGGGIGVIAFLIYLFLAPIMNGNLAKKTEEPKVAATQTATEDKKETKQDGDVYAKLALQRQADELAKLNGQKTLKEPIETPYEKKNKLKKLPQTTTAKGTQQVVANNVSPTSTPRTTPFYSSPPIPKPQVTLPQTEVTTLQDPLAELERLRSLGSAGRIDYMANVASIENESSSDNTDDTDYTPRRRSSDRHTSTTETQEVANIPSNHTTASTSGEIEQLQPKWTPVVSVASINKDELNDNSSNEDYSSEEAGIIEGKQEQYLVVGEHAAATLQTPLIWSPGSRSSNPQPQFVARLTEPLKSNTGKEAIPVGTLLSIEMQGVDPNGRAIAQVTAILKDGTEYPVSPGTIAVLGKGGNPLIASQYHNKGGEIFSLDVGLGLVSGLAKAGEIINQPDVQTSISQSDGGFSSVQTSRNGKQSIGAAFLSGAFGAVSEQVKARNQKALEEISKRPNIWFVKKGTKILITVNRSLQL
ncbi:MAG: conjugal transfer protein TrbI [Pelatocladus maniniholoensis HA4357-MV3]|jgi:hypothetical protein|uniref:Conjugal transfer protein TrbI n=1 Tax=Pelatocladus maniniholoensis HA4357-MV3 TaxID=1117104 RepID=A0A9E3HD47_9NOST|nr:conjugal transfer protein TrbI [Pelatocladus maniniholoensis HA4357-MV3]